MTGGDGSSSDGESANEHSTASAEPDADAHQVFWADEIADEIEARDPTDPIVIKGGVSPSGVPHLGHFNEIMRGYYVAAVLRERGHEVRQIFTSDDRDALRSVPRTLADLEWNLLSLGDIDAGALGQNLGVPYTDIPDPFEGCDCASYGDHFTNLLSQSAAAVDVPIEVVSTTSLYDDGRIVPVVRHILENADIAREVLTEYQDTVDENYVPFMPQCPDCGKLTTDVRAVDLDGGTVTFTCSGLTAGGKDIDGCGFEGTVTFAEGKLPWRFEWPAEWQVLDVDFEPFGKDHAEGSWPSGVDIAETVLGIEPPVPMVYEWFTLNGEPLSSSAGNIVTVDEVLDLLEPEVLRYFFVLNPKKARDLDLSRLDQLVDDFDRFEAAYYGEVDDEDLQALAERAYPFVVDADDETLDERAARVRLPYTFAAVLGMVDDEDFREQLARDEGHITDKTPDWAVEQALERVEKARAWAERMDNEYNYRLQTDLPDVDVGDDVAAALADLADFVAAGHSGEEIQGEMYETARRHDIEVSDFFEVGYRLFFDDTEGPRLGEFLGELERDFVVDRLRRTG